MGSQDQHREGEPQTAADAFAKAAEHEQAAADSGTDAAAEHRGEASRLRHLAGRLRIEERRRDRRAKSARDAVDIDAMRAARRAERGLGGDAA